MVVRIKRMFATHRELQIGSMDASPCEEIPSLSKHTAGDGGSAGVAGVGGCEGQGGEGCGQQAAKRGGGKLAGDGGIQGFQLLARGDVTRSPAEDEWSAGSEDNGAPTEGINWALLIAC
jgi:hypothetical protein